MVNCNSAGAPADSLSTQCDHFLNQVTGEANFGQKHVVSAVVVQVIQSFDSIFKATAPQNTKDQIRDIYRCLNTPEPYSLILNYTKYEDNQLTKFKLSNEILSPFVFKNDQI